MNWAVVIACLGFLAGGGLLICGVYVLAGHGWALLTGSVPCFALSAVIVRGLD